MNNHKSGLEKPILIIAYNRPKQLEALIKRLEEFKPLVLMMFFDGPKENRSDRLKVRQTRELIHKITWKCNLRTLMAPHNLGCGKGMVAAINWGFQNYEELIILEDDILPSSLFFRLMSDSLDKFKNEYRILGIGGFNRIADHSVMHDVDSIFLTKYPSIWGWCTWKDRWELYNFNIFENQINFFLLLKNNNFNIFITLYFIFNFYKISNKKLDTWDYQLTYLAFLSKKFFVLPKTNLVENTGFGEDATHTFTKIAFPSLDESMIYHLTYPSYQKKVDKVYRKQKMRDFIKLTINYISKIG